MKITAAVRMRRIEEEYGIPFWDVVKGFADDGESVNAIAAIFDWPPSSFFEHIHRHGAMGWFVSQYASNGFLSSLASKREKRTKFNTAPATAARLAKAKKVEFGGIADTIAGHARRSGISDNTAYRRLKNGMPLEQAFARRSPKAKRQPDNHPWRVAERRSFAAYQER